MNRMFSPFNNFMIVGQDEAQEHRNVADLFDSIDAEFIGVEFSELATLLVFLRSVAQIHLSHHWQAKGCSFYGDHLMFERIYKENIEQIDELGERTVGLGCAELVDPEIQARLQVRVCEWICGVYSLSCDNETDNNNVRVSMAAEDCFQAAVQLAWDRLEQAGQLARHKGLENLLAQLADDHEATHYLLKRATDSY